MAEEKKEHDNKMKKMEAEMEQVFEMKVQEKQAKLKESEADVRPPVDILKGIGGQANILRPSCNNVALSRFFFFFFFGRGLQLHRISVMVQVRE